MRRFGRLIALHAIFNRTYILAPLCDSLQET